jgi:CheY-like chemotaxis protein
MAGRSSSEQQKLLMLRPGGNGSKAANSQGSTSDNRPIAIRVDEVLGPEEVVVRKLPPLIAAHPIFCGLTLSGRAETVLLIDAGQLTRFCSQITSQITEAEQVSTPVSVRSVISGPLHMLVVDDSMSARKLLVKKLMSYGFAVSEAADGVEALEKIRNSDFALVFTDLDMPRMGGLELLFDLQQRRQNKQRVVVVSSRAEHEFGERALELGAMDYMTKPVEDDNLATILFESGLIDSTKGVQRR